MSPSEERRDSDFTDDRKGIRLRVSTTAHPEFDGPLEAFAFNQTGTLVDRSTVDGGSVSLSLSEADAAKGRIFVAPVAAELADTTLTPAQLERLGAYEPVLRAGHAADFRKAIDIPASILRFWPWCWCLVQGKVVRDSDGLPVCNARVHVCDVEWLPWIRKLPPLQVFKLRDDLLAALRNPPPPRQEIVGPIVGPGPDPASTGLRLLSIEDKPADARATVASEQLRVLPLELATKLESQSAHIVRETLASQWQLIYPYFCLWPHWWGILTCNELAVVDTDPNGRFETILPYLCSGDTPDVYFWVEYDFGSGFEDVYNPPIACWTYWDYVCGTAVTIKITDPRVPACGGEPSLDGKEVWIVSVGRTVSVEAIKTDTPDPASEGLVSWSGDPASYSFGAKLEPRVWFSSDTLLGDGITHYLWSKKGPLDADWVPLTRHVFRHFTAPGGLAPSYDLGPEFVGANTGRFKIRPKNPPSAWPLTEWLVADETEDLASAHFETLGPAATGNACGVADPLAGKHELKLELFDATGSLVVWEDAPGGPITLRHTTGEAPFGTGTVNTVVSDDYHRIKDLGGKTVAFRMVLHVDNSLCGADIPALAGSGITVEPECGVVTLTGPSPTLDAKFSAGRPGGLANFSFATQRGLATPIVAASASGRVDDAADGGFTRSGCVFSKDAIPVSAFLSPPGSASCTQGAFAESVSVAALTQNGYGRLTGLDAYKIAAFMLTTPCPPTPPTP